MARPCSICCCENKRQTAADLIASGATDQVIADHLGVGRMAVQRHRINHIIKPTQDRLAIVAKGAPARQERQQIAAAAAAGAPSPQQVVDALLGLQAQAAKLQGIEDRLERMAAVAETNNSTNGVAQLAAQQLRGVEVGAKLAGVGSYAPQKPAASAAGGVFSVNILFSNGVQETITTVAAPPSFTGEGGTEAMAQEPARGQAGRVLLDAE